LRVEIQQLKGLLELTSKESPERPRILRRLAENYTELAWAAPRESESARTYASQYYTTLVKEHRTHCAAPPEKGCADEALYYLGLELELLGNYDMARKNYFMLVRDFPQSTFVPYAYFAFGELFFSEGMKGDPSKLPLAEQAYEKVTQFTDSPVAPEALLRLAQMADAAGDVAKAERYRTRASTMMPAYAPAPPSPTPR
jgi:TolA-binding protein